MSSSSTRSDKNRKPTKNNDRPKAAELTICVLAKAGGLFLQCLQRTASKGPGRTQMWAGRAQIAFQSVKAEALGGGCPAARGHGLHRLNGNLCTEGAPGSVYGLPTPICALPGPSEAVL